MKIFWFNVRIIGKRCGLCSDEPYHGTRDQLRMEAGHQCYRFQWNDRRCLCLRHCCGCFGWGLAGEAKYLFQESSALAGNVATLVSLKPEAPVTVRNTQNPIIRRNELPQFDIRCPVTLPHLRSKHSPLRTNQSHSERNCVFSPRYRIDIDYESISLQFCMTWNCVCRFYLSNLVLQVISEKCFLAKGVDKKLSSFAERSL